MTAPEIFELLKVGGWALSPLLFYLLVDEKKERRATQAKLEDLSAKTLILLTELKGLVSGKGAAS